MNLKLSSPRRSELFGYLNEQQSHKAHVGKLKRFFSELFNIKSTLIHVSPLTLDQFATLNSIFPEELPVYATELKAILPSRRTLNSNDARNEKAKRKLPNEEDEENDSCSYSVAEIISKSLDTQKKRFLSRISGITAPSKNGVTFQLLPSGKLVYRANISAIATYLNIKTSKISQQDKEQPISCGAIDLLALSNSDKNSLEMLLKNILADGERVPLFLHVSPVFSDGKDIPEDGKLSKPSIDFLEKGSKEGALMRIPTAKRVYVLVNPESRYSKETEHKIEKEEIKDNDIGDEILFSSPDINESQDEADSNDAVLSISKCCDTNIFIKESYAVKKGTFSDIPLDKMLGTDLCKYKPKLNVDTIHKFYIGFINKRVLRYSGYKPRSTPNFKFYIDLSEESASEAYFEQRTKEDTIMTSSTAHRTNEAEAQYGELLKEISKHYNTENFGIGANISYGIHPTLEKEESGIAKLPSIIGGSAVCMWLLEVAELFKKEDFEGKWITISLSIDNQNILKQGDVLTDDRMKFNDIQCTVYVWRILGSVCYYLWYDEH